jgi:hypothetical protein
MLIPFHERDGLEAERNGITKSGQDTARRIQERATAENAKTREAKKLS